MRRSIILVSSLGFFLLASCSSTLDVRNSNGKVVGQIQVQAAQTATIVNTRGDVRGKVRGTVVRDDSGKHVGTIVEKDGHTVIMDASDNAIGSLSNGTDCYGKGQDVVGHVSEGVDSTVAAGACLLFFLQ